MRLPLIFFNPNLYVKTIIIEHASKIIQEKNICEKEVKRIVFNSKPGP